MRKIVKRCLMVVAVLLVALLIAAAVGYYLIGRRPAFYHAYQWDASRQSELNQQAVEKLTATRNMLRRAWQQEVTSAAPVKTDPAITVRFTEEELNALLLHNAKDALDRQFEGFGIFLRPGQVILAGYIKEHKYFGSFIFQPNIDERGQLHLPLVRSMAGKLPLPSAVVDKQREKGRSSLAGRLPGWQGAARIDANGAFNEDAVAAAMGRLLFNALMDQSSEAILFFPEPEKKAGALPMRLVEVQVEQEALTVRVEPLSLQERRELIERIRKQR